MNSRETESGLAKQIRSKWFRRWGVTLAAFAAASVAAVLLVGPPCPDRVVIATGRPDGAYFGYAKRYAEILERDGVQLDVQPSAGSLDNLERLERGEATVALVQGGVADTAKHDDLVSLCSVYSEPIWVFYRRSRLLRDQTSSSDSSKHATLRDLEGKRVAVGAPGSGTRAVAEQLLRELKVVDSSGRGDYSTRMEPLGGSDAAQALLGGQLDAAFFVIAADSPLVKQLLVAPDIELMSFERAKAFQNRFPFLSSVTLGAGVIDLHANLPSRDTKLLAPTANLVCRRDMHSALVPLFMKAAYQVHEEGGFLDEPATFPSTRNLDLPINSDARRYMRSGPSPFYKYLPFQLAVGIDRTKLFLLPLLTLLIPLMKTAPPIYRWRIRWKIFRWYRGLREIDARMHKSETDWDIAADIKVLRKMEAELSEVSVPLSYMYEFYALRMHIDFMMAKVQELEERRAKGNVRRAA